MPADLLEFEVAGHACALRLSSVQEILPMPRLARAAGLPSVLEGFLNLRGTAVPVIRLERLFDRPARQPGLYDLLVVLRGGALALLVERVLDILTAAPESFLPVQTGHCFNGCTEAEVPAGGSAIHLLSPERLLLEKEQQCLAELQAQVQRYLQEAGVRA